MPTDNIQAATIPNSDYPPPQVSRRRDLLAIMAMALAVLIVYCPIQLFQSDSSLIGLDYESLHLYRLRFARESLSASPPRLPGWYPRELMGTPFWSNIQSFPFIPNRLVLLALDPDRSYAAGVNLAALLAALFTYLFLRRLSLSPLGAAAGGWTFACSGYFASRVMAGHLPLLEAYPALPILLWCCECEIQAELDGRPPGRRLLALGLAALAVSLAGHPQLPFYALAVAGLYALYRDLGVRAWRRIAALLLGWGASGFVLWPAMKLIGRSTRVLDLAAPNNDIAFPYERLAALVLPWRDGWPAIVNRPPGPGVTALGNVAVFWDTVAYVGLVPLLAVLALAARAVILKRAPTRAGTFFAAAGTLALLLSLPWIQRVSELVPAVIFRSPARQLYITTFALALALGVMIDVIRRARTTRFGVGLTLAVPIVLLVHALDLGRHDRAFIAVEPTVALDRQLADTIKSFARDGRVAVDLGRLNSINRELDDVGFFDSIILARPYQGLLSLTGAPPGLNIQTAAGSRFNQRTLAYAGVTYVFSDRDLDLPPAPGDFPGGAGRVYSVPDPSARANFLPFSAALYLPEPEIYLRLRDQNYDARHSILLSPAARPGPEPEETSLVPGPPAPAPAPRCRRPSSDLIICRIETKAEGYLRIIESYDEGWSAAVDGRPAKIEPADGMVMAVRIQPGDHEVVLAYRTPGANTGLAVTVICLALLAALAVTAGHCIRPADCVTNLLS